MTELANTALRLATKLFADLEQREAFVQALQTPRPYEPALVWIHDRPTKVPFSVLPSRIWQPDYVDRVSIDERPGQHPLHEQGDYYCLDISSVFTSQVLSAVITTPQLILDLCASPGGKSLLAWRRFRPKLLVCNEVIRKRTAALIANLQRCRIREAMVTSRDTSKLAEAWQHVADLVIVDAPCSGQSLIARGKPSPGCFHPSTINLNTNRQRRILANAARLVAPNGYLAYITCTYAAKENEGNLEWFTKRFPDFTPCPVPLLDGFRSHLSNLPAYRLWPQQELGAGGFACLLQRTATVESAPEIHRDAIRPIWTSESARSADTQ